MERNEVKAGSSHLNEKQPIDSSTSSKGVNKPKEKVVTTSVFVNHAEISWHESRRKWVGDQSQQQQKMAKDPIISWSTTYEELLCNNQPFPEPIPLPEEAIAEGADDEELEELRVRLDRGHSFIKFS